MSTKNNPKKKRALIRYFETIYRKFSKLIQLNLIYFAFILPLVCGAIYFCALLFGLSAEAIQTFFFIHMSVWVTELIPLPIFIVLFLASLVLYGPITAGFTHCIRDIACGKHIWVSDIFKRAKSNFKQGLLFGMIDVLVFISFVLYLSYDMSSFGFFGTVLKLCAIAITVVYICLRFYTYTIAVTFELSVKNIFKNSLIFSVLGFLGNIIALFVSGFIMFTFVSTPKVDLVLIATLIFALCRFTSVFCTYPTIERYMLKEQKNASAVVVKEEVE